MILEYTYKNHAWGYVFQRLVFDIKAKKVYYESNNSPLSWIATIEPHEIDEFEQHLKQANLSNIQFTALSNAFDAGDKEYFVVNSSNKIKIGQKGNTQMESSDSGTNNLVMLVDKYVGLALELVR